jgi:hypothetical protein
MFDSRLRAAWLYLALVVARVVSLLIIGFVDQIAVLLPDVLMRAVPPALLSDLALVILYYALRQKPLAQRIAVAVGGAYAVSFLIEVALGRAPSGSKLPIAVVTGLLHGALFLGGLHVLRKLRPAMAVALSLFGAIFVASAVGDVLTFVSLDADASKIGYLVRASSLTLRHSAIYAAVAGLVLAAMARPSKRPEP